MSYVSETLYRDVSVTSYSYMSSYMTWQGPRCYPVKKKRGIRMSYVSEMYRVRTFWHMTCLSICNALQHTATTHCNILQHTTTHHSTTHCNTLQHTATHRTFWHMTCLSIWRNWDLGVVRNNVSVIRKLDLYREDSLTSDKESWTLRGL